MNGSDRTVARSGEPFLHRRLAGLEATVRKGIHDLRIHLAADARRRKSLCLSGGTWVDSNLEQPAVLQPLVPSISLRAAALEEFHGDPADRMIVATALELDQVLLTADRKIVRWYGARPGMGDRVFAL